MRNPVRPDTFKEKGGGVSAHTPAAPFLLARVEAAAWSHISTEGKSNRSLRRLHRPGPFVFRVRVMIQRKGKWVVGIHKLRPRPALLHTYDIIGIHSGYRLACHVRTHEEVLDHSTLGSREK